jgi:hypothetical protein
MDLFLDNELTFEKLGYEARLSEDLNNWPQEIIDQLYKQAPFASDFTPKVVLDKVDPDKRYAMGHVELRNRLAINRRDDNTPPELRGQQKILIPVVIKDSRLAPMDLLLNNGSVEPLTEPRLRRALFRPSLFEAVRQRPGDQTLIDQIYPPFRSYGGGRGPMGGPLISESVGTKLGSAQPQMLLDAILPTIKTAHVDYITERLNNDVDLRNSLLNNPSALHLLSKVASVTDVPAQNYMAQVLESIPPKVIQIQKLASGYRIKTANPDMLAPTTDDVSRPEAERAMGSDIISKVDQSGSVTMATTPAIRSTLEDVSIKTVTEFGLYKVKDIASNKELVGWVFPSVTDFDGAVLPLALFSNGTQAALQEEIAGVLVGNNTNILDSEPQGSGCFYRSTTSGAVALTPVEIKGQIQNPEGVGYSAVLPMGEVITIVKVPGLKSVTKIDEGRYGIPEDCGFMSMDGLIEVASSPDEFLKTAQAWDALSTVEAITDGTTFSFRGPALDKVATIMNTKFIDLDEAVFLAACLGNEPEEARTKLSGALHTGGSVELHVHPITTFKEKVAEARKHAHELLKKFPDLRADLLKEAAIIEDPTAVDKILSVGFLSPENVSIFASYIPEIEAAVKKLSELLLASRLGLSSISEGALQKAIIHLDKVLTGLSALAATPQA